MGPSLLAGGVDNGAPGPGLERCIPAELSAASNEPGERVLNGLARGFTLTDERSGSRNEVRKPTAVERLDLGEQLLVR